MHAFKHLPWDEVPIEHLSDTISRQMISGERVMVAKVFLKEGAVVPKHHHDNEQVTFIISGALKFWMGDEGEEVIVRAGEVLHIPSNVPHKAQALEDTLDLDIFSPPRQDWLKGDDAYLRG